MKTVFIEVKVEDELPEKDGHYIAWMDDESLEFEPFKLGVGWWTETVGPQHLKVKTWFKEVPITELLPSEKLNQIYVEWLESKLLATQEQGESTDQWVKGYQAATKHNLSFQDGWDAAIKTQEQGEQSHLSDLLPSDAETKNWYDDNIDEECSASSGIYKFRLWLNDYVKQQLNEK